MQLYNGGGGVLSQPSPPGIGLYRDFAAPTGPRFFRFFL